MVSNYWEVSCLLPTRRVKCRSVNQT
jgi:hypothetical protein